MLWRPWQEKIAVKKDAPLDLLNTQGKGETISYTTKAVASNVFSLCAMRGNSLVFIGFSQTEEGLSSVLLDAKNRMSWRKSLWTPLAGDLPQITALELWGTPFQRAVWHELLNIPEGKIVSYQSIAEKIGHPSASRAVGSAIGANPIAGLIPCHRVVNKQADMGSYHWGWQIKELFLRDEQESLSKRIGKLEAETLFRTAQEKAIQDHLAQSQPSLFL